MISTFGLFLTGGKSFFEFTLDVDNKNLEITKVFLEKNFKLWLYDKNSALVAEFMLGLSKNNNVIKN